jgi:hypothetical protein
MIDLLRIGKYIRKSLYNDGYVVNLNQRLNNNIEEGIALII